MPIRPQLDLKRPLVAAREFIFAGKAFEKGDPFPVDGFNPRLIRRQYEARAIEHPQAVVEAEAENPIKMTGPSGGRYTITAPWLEHPEVIRGKKLADDRFAELTEAGPPLGWIEGGTEVTVEGGTGGWYEVDAPWLESPEKVQGHAAAEARQLELHTAGAPAPQEPELKPLEGNDRFVIVSVDGKVHTVHTAWLDEPERFNTAEEAEARQAELRAEGPPQGWEPPTNDDSAGGGDNAGPAAA